MPFNGRPDVTETQLRWQVFSSLAFGAKGLLYFCFWSPTGQSNGFQWGNAILTLRALPGQPAVYVEGPHFAQVQRINGKLLPLGRALLRAVSTRTVRVLGANASTPVQGGNITAVSNAIAPTSFSVLLGVFAGSWAAAGTGAALSQAVLLHNQDVDFPLLLRVELAAGAPPPHELGADGALSLAWNDAPAAPGLSIYLEAGDARALFF